MSVFEQRSRADLQHAGSEDSLWWVQVDVETYGPYTTEQMRGYITEGRVTAESTIRQDAEPDWHTAVDDEVFGPLFGRSTFSSDTSAHAATANRMTNFVVMVEGSEYSREDFNAALNELGPVHELMPGIWLLDAFMPATRVRNHLVEHLHTSERMFVLDVRNQRYSWYNFGPKVDLKIRKVLDAGD